MTNRWNFRGSAAHVLLIALLVPLIAACGGASGGQPTAGPAGAPTTAPATGEAEQPGTGGEGQQGQLPGTGTASEAELAPPEQQIFRAYLTSEPESIDPALSQSTSEEVVLKQLFTGLTRINPDLEPEPAIAESWEFNEDNTQITFTLRETTWSDGQPLTARDFEYAWKRYLDPRTASPYASLASDVIQGGAELVGAETSDDAQLDQLREALGVRAVDDRTLQVDLAIPAPFFPSLVALGTMAPVRQDIIEANGDRWTEVGTLVGNGPFVLQDYTPGSSMTFAPNPNYFEGPPTLQQLTINFITDDATAFANYQADELDITAVPPAEVPGIQRNPDLSSQIALNNQLATYYFSFNVTQPPFDNVQVRQAFAHAIDRQTLVDQVLSGIPQPAWSFIPPGVPGHITREEAGEAAQTFDPERARQLLAEAGYPNGENFPPVSLAFNNNGSHALIAERVQADLQENLGIQVELDPREATTYFSEVQDNPPPFFRAGWNADYADPYNFDRLVFGPGSSQNYGMWENLEFTRLLDEADTAATPEERIAAYQEAEKVLAQDAGSVFVYWYRTFRLVKPWVRGMYYTAQDPEPGAFSYKDIQILNH
ncbi:MAG: peptide ABC transporter substrate-binding protein [Chloroflexota bacterium]